MDSLKAWEDAATEASGITTEQLDKKVVEFLELTEDYENKKEISTKAYNAVAKCKSEMQDLLEKCGKTKYLAEGLGTMSLVMKKSTKVPKDIANKKLMLGHFREMGEEAYINFVSIHSATLNSYINQQLEENPDFKMPGIEEQKITPEVRFRKSK